MKVAKLRQKPSRERVPPRPFQPEKAEASCTSDPAGGDASESAPEPPVSDRSGRTEPEPPRDASRAVLPPGVDLVRIAAKARLLARVLVGDERLLADELVTDIEALVGPVANVVSLADRRARG